MGSCGETSRGGKGGEERADNAQARSFLQIAHNILHVHLEAASTAQMLATEHAAEALPGVGVSVEDVHLEVPLLAGADVGAVGAVPASESLHHHHIGQTILI